MMGGKLPPCLPDDWLREYEEEHGRKCPHIELAPQNEDAFFLVNLYLSEDTRPFLTPVGMSFGFKHEWDYTRRTWFRIKGALANEEFNRAWEEAVERSKREKPPSEDADDSYLNEV